MKTKEEQNALKEELKQVAGGNSWNEYWGEDGFIKPGGGSGSSIPSPTQDRTNTGGGNSWNEYWGEY